VTHFAIFFTVRRITVIVTSDDNDVIVKMEWTDDEEDSLVKKAAKNTFQRLQTQHHVSYFYRIGYRIVN